mmetsp:Transcript_41490/g.90332  ORF Transcript_41490/g.90332 Transcript_41490/m.90332 type:complete len:217 (-) Transcript_41490:973-1623(-)
MARLPRAARHTGGPGMGKDASWRPSKVCRRNNLSVAVTTKLSPMATHSTRPGMVISQISGFSISPRCTWIRDSSGPTLANTLAPSVIDAIENSRTLRNRYWCPNSSRPRTSMKSSFLVMVPTWLTANTSRLAPGWNGRCSSQVDSAAICRGSTSWSPTPQSATATWLCTPTSTTVAASGRPVCTLPSSSATTGFDKVAVVVRSCGAVASASAAAAG